MCTILALSINKGFSMKTKITSFTRKGSDNKFRFEHSMINTCADELLKFAKENNFKYFLYEFLLENGELQHGMKVEIIKLYCNDDLVGYASIESNEFRKDKVTIYNQTVYQDLGLIHFATALNHRNKGYASLLANIFYKDVVTPLFSRHDKNSFIIATGRAIALIERTGIDMDRVVLDFYSPITFENKVINKRLIAA
jgi:hypothetical protein